ncbi:Histone-lysine N-methyltransferase EZ1 [Platanthera guangdongensis]|uniref:Histone-lysine N-methyltransferase EZ1 n=1 Tax=Platanthera guangdongensis TaxID=2320717 RepID=A0ABR2MWQ6_9ASPA
MNTSQDILLVIDSLKKQVAADRCIFIKKKIEENKQKLGSITQHIYNMSKFRRSVTIENNDDGADLLRRRQNDALCMLSNLDLSCPDRDSSSYQEESSHTPAAVLFGHNFGGKNSIRPIKLAEVPKLPPYTTWIFLDRNQRMSEDQSVVGRRRIYYDSSCGEALICSDSEEEVIEEEDDKKAFGNIEDYILSFHRLIFGPTSYVRCARIRRNISLPVTRVRRDFPRLASCRDTLARSCSSTASRGAVSATRVVRLRLFTDKRQFRCRGPYAYFAVAALDNSSLAQTQRESHGEEEAGSRSSRKKKSQKQSNDRVKCTGEAKARAHFYNRGVSGQRSATRNGHGLNQARYNNILLAERSDNCGKSVPKDGKIEDSIFDKDLDAALDSFDNLFCRRCLVFDCRLHGCSHDLVFPSEKQLPWSCSDDGSPCGSHCYRMASKSENTLTVNLQIPHVREELTNANVSAGKMHSSPRKKSRGSSNARKVRPNHSGSASSSARVSAESSESEVRPYPENSIINHSLPSNNNLGAKGGNRKRNNKRVAERVLVCIKKRQKQMVPSDSDSVVNGSIVQQDMKLRSKNCYRKKGAASSFHAKVANKAIGKSKKKKLVVHEDSNSTCGVVEKETQDGIIKETPVTNSEDILRKEFVDDIIASKPAVVPPQIVLSPSVLAVSIPQPSFQPSAP